MPGRHPWDVRARFYLNILALYLFSIGFIWYLVQPPRIIPNSVDISITKAEQKPLLPKSIVPIITLVAGLPVRIVIPSESVDLPVDPGYYDSADDSWTLSGTRAQFAMMSTLANNISGNTFIYGHNNDHVFGALRHVTPSIGASALVYTTNGHIFLYNFVSVTSLTPDDTSVLNYQGPPILTIQTCTGSVNEWRTMYQFSFNQVMQ